MASNDELDLEAGNAVEAARILDAQKTQTEGRARRAARRSTSKSGTTGRATTAKAKVAEETLAARLMRTFDRIVDTLRAREDEELAVAIDEDKEAMTQGLVSLTKALPFLRNPLLITLNLVEPVLAFGRVGRILFGRVRIWRGKRIADLEQRQAEYDAAVAAGTVAP